MTAAATLVAYARRSYDQAVNSASRQLRIFTASEGGSEHTGLDHLPQVSTYIAGRAPARSPYPSRRSLATSHAPIRQQPGRAPPNH